MATISTLNSKLTLNTRSFTTGVDRARAVTRKFGGAVGRGTLKVAKYGGALVTAAVGGVALITKHHLAAIDASAKFADEVGISTEALAGYRHNAELTGTSNATLEKGLQRMVRVVGDANRGVTASATALEQLGLSAEHLAAVGPEQALLDIADAIKAQPDATSKASAAYAVFGRQGQELLTFLNQGSEGIRANSAEAVKLGLAYSRVDAAKVEAANDSITRVKGLVAGAGQAITVQLAPFIDAAATKLVEMGSSGEGMGNLVVAGVELVSLAVAKAADGFGFLKAAVNGAQAGISFALGVATQGITLFGKAIEAVLNLIPGVEVRLSDSLQILSDELFAASKDAAERSQAAFDSAFNGENSAAVTQIFDDIRNGAQSAAEALHNQSDAAQQGAIDFEAMEQAAKNTEKVTKTLTDLDAELERFGLSDVEIKIADLKALGATNDQLDRARETLEKINALEKGRERQGQITDTLEDLERQVRTFGLSKKELTLLDLEALGATDAQLQQAAESMDQLIQLQARGTAGAGTGLITAGSAESQRLAFQAARGNRSQGSDDTPKRQLAKQGQIFGVLQQIEQNQRSQSDQTFDI